MTQQTSNIDEPSEKRKRFVLQIIFYVVGLVVTAFGIAFAINSRLGITPVTSFPYAISVVSGIRIGTCVTIFLIFCIFIQFILLRKEFKLIELTQIIVATAFGFFVDFAIFVLGDFGIPTYAGQLTMLAISIVIVSFGLVMYLDAKLVLMPVEGLTTVIAQKLSTSFHRVKIVLDCIFVLLSITITFAFLNEIYGVREGTVISAIVIGKLLPYCRALINMILRKIKLYNLLNPEQMS